MLGALRAAGVDAVAIVRPREARDRICLDLRSSAARAASPAIARSVWLLEIGEERGGVPAFTEATRGASTSIETIDVRFP